MDYYIDELYENIAEYNNVLINGYTLYREPQGSFYLSNGAVDVYCSPAWNIYCGCRRMSDDVGIHIMGDDQHEMILSYNITGDLEVDVNNYFNVLNEYLN